MCNDDDDDVKTLFCMNLGKIRRSEWLYKADLNRVIDTLLMFLKLGKFKIFTHRYEDECVVVRVTVVWISDHSTNICMVFLLKYLQNNIKSPLKCLFCVPVCTRMCCTNWWLLEKLFKHWLHWCGLTSAPMAPPKPTPPRWRSLACCICMALLCINICFCEENEGERKRKKKKSLCISTTTLETLTFNSTSDFSVTSSTRQKLHTLCLSFHFLSLYFYLKTFFGKNFKQVFK